MQLSSFFFNVQLHDEGVAKWLGRKFLVKDFLVHCPSSLSFAPKCWTVQEVVWTKTESNQKSRLEALRCRRSQCFRKDICRTVILATVLFLRNVVVLVAWCFFCCSSCSSSSSFLLSLLLSSCLLLAVDSTNFVRWSQEIAVPLLFKIEILSWNRGNRNHSPPPEHYRTVSHVEAFPFPTK